MNRRINWIIYLLVTFENFSRGREPCTVWDNSLNDFPKSLRGPRGQHFLCMKREIKFYASLGVYNFPNSSDDFSNIITVCTAVPIFSWVLDESKNYSQVSSSVIPSDFWTTFENYYNVRMADIILCPEPRTRVKTFFQLPESMNPPSPRSIGDNY